MLLSSQRMHVVMMRARAVLADAHWNDIYLAVSYAFFGDNRPRKCSHPLGRAAQNESLDAIVVVEMGMHRGKCQIVMTVLRIHQSGSQVAFMMVIDVADRRDTVARIPLSNAGCVEFVSHQIAKSL